MCNIPPFPQMALSCLFKSIGNNRNSSTVDDFFDKDINTDVYFAIIYEKMCYIASKTIDVYCLGSNVSFLFCQTFVQKVCAKIWHFLILHL